MEKPVRLAKSWARRVRCGGKILPALLLLLALSLPLSCGDSDPSTPQDTGQPVYDAPLIDPVATPTALSTALISGTTVANATVNISGSATAVGTADSAGRFSITVNLATSTTVDTVNTLAVSAQLGSDSSHTATVIITHDGVAPAAPALDPVLSPTNLSTLTVSGDTEPNATVNITGGLSPMVLTADAQGDFSQTVSLLHNQTNNIFVTATDLAGNVSPASPIVVVHDNIAPPVADTARIKAWFDGTDVRISGGFLTVEGGITVNLVNVSTLSSATVTAQSNGMFTAVLSGGASGQYVRISSTDGAGNVSATPHPEVVASLTWSEIAETGVPVARFGATLTMDMKNNRAILFGGRDAAGPRADTTWSLDLTQGSEGWTQIVAGGGPSARFGHCAGFDPFSNHVIIFGGDDGSNRQNDLYLLDVTTPGSESWSLVTPSSGSPPAARSYAAGFFNPWNGWFTVYGGKDGAVTHTDVVEYPLPLIGLGTDHWNTILVQGTAPSGRWGHSAAVDVNRGRVVFFGGVNQGGSYTQDTIALSLQTVFIWNVLAPGGTAPPVRACHTGVADTVGNHMVINGGHNGSQALNTTYFFDLATDAWITPTPAITGLPPAREQAAGCFDLTTLRPLLFGGTTNDAAGTITNDLWQLE